MYGEISWINVGLLFMKWLWFGGWFNTALNEWPWHNWHNVQCNLWHIAQMLKTPMDFNWSSTLPHPNPPPPLRCTIDIDGMGLGSVYGSRKSFEKKPIKMLVQQSCQSCRLFSSYQVMALHFSISHTLHIFVWFTKLPKNVSGHVAGPSPPVLTFVSTHLHLTSELIWIPPSQSGVTDRPDSGQRKE